MKQSEHQESGMAISILVLVLLAFLAISPSDADENNLILTGQVLGTNRQLSDGVATLAVQGDCNLVLYNEGPGFQSNTHGKGTNCTLTLNELGQLVILDAHGQAIWTTPLILGSKRGDYAAVLRHDGQVAIYGASVWSTPGSFRTANGTRVSNGGKGKTSKNPMMRNVMFSDQIIFKTVRLTSRDYTLLMKKDCNLALVKASVGDCWVSGTHGKGKNCFARLSRRGELVVNDFRHKTLWSSSSTGNNNREGEYVLVLQMNGQAVIYGPLLWSTASH